MQNSYIIAFVAACVTYVVLFSSLKKKTEQDETVNMEALMYSIGAGAVAFAIVHFLVNTENKALVEVPAPKAVPNTKPPNATVGLTGETITTDPFPN